MKVNTRKRCYNCKKPQPTRVVTKKGRKMRCYNIKTKSHTSNVLAHYNINRQILVDMIPYGKTR